MLTVKKFVRSSKKEEKQTACKKITISKKPIMLGTFNNNKSINYKETSSSSSSLKKDYQIHKNFIKRMETIINKMNLQTHKKLIRNFNAMKNFSKKLTKLINRNNNRYKTRQKKNKIQVNMRI